jgi:D-sedoheptulose 7-phosphate isomerase
MPNTESTNDSMTEQDVARALEESASLHGEVARGDLTAILAAARAIVHAFETGRTLLVFGNGGSAADAQHMVAELVGRFGKDRAALSAVALTVDSSVLTSVANDHGYDHVFARQIEALGRAGDVALAISTSGRSPNVLCALDAARTRGLRTIALTGCDGGDAGRVANIHINVPSSSTPRVQEVHRTLMHVVCDFVERTLFPTV